MERFEETLHEKQVIVLGGSLDIGLETARLARAQGAKLVLVARDEHKLETASRALGGSARTAVFDIADEGAVRTFFEHIGSIDHVLLAAGADLEVATQHWLTREGSMSLISQRKFNESRQVPYVHYVHSSL